MLSIKYDELRTKQEVWCDVLNFLGISCADLVLLHSSLKKDITKVSGWVLFGSYLGPI